MEQEHAIDTLLDLSETNEKRIKKIRELVDKTWRESRHFIKPYTPHDATHSLKIEEILISLLLLDNEEGRKQARTNLNDNEKFLLLAAVWLHDIGMCPTLKELSGLSKHASQAEQENWDAKVRAEHHKRSAQFVKQNETLKSVLTENERDFLSTICFFHRRAENIPLQQYDKIRLIIAYIRLADALHIPDRAPLSELRTYLAYGMDPVAKYHWFKSFFILYAGPSKDNPWKIMIKIKKPVSWNGNAEQDMASLKWVINTELNDELDSIKDILVNGKYKYELPAYTEIEFDFDEVYLSNDEIADLRELLGIIELFNPTLSPNAGKMIGIVLNQIERIVDINPDVHAEDAIHHIKNYQEYTLNKLLAERPCHAYICNLRDDIHELIKNLDSELSPSPKLKTFADKTKISINFILKIQEKIKALKWWHEKYKSEIQKQLKESGKSEGMIKIKDQIPDSPLLYGYSGSVIFALDVLPDDIKKRIDVFVCEGTTKTKHRYDNKLIYCDGIHYVEELKKIGIKNIYLVPDICASNLFLPYSEDEKEEIEKSKEKRKRVDLVIFGANGIDIKTGEIFHSLGHLAVADMAEKYNIPIYVIAEGLKFKEKIKKSPEKQREEAWYSKDISVQDILKDTVKYNPREDVIPLNKVTQLITEFGRFEKDKAKDSIDVEMKKISKTIREIEELYSIPPDAQRPNASSNKKKVSSI